MVHGARCDYNHYICCESEWCDSMVRNITHTVFDDLKYRNGRLFFSFRCFSSQMSYLLLLFASVLRQRQPDRGRSAALGVKPKMCRVPSSDLTCRKEEEKKFLCLDTLVRT